MSTFLKILLFVDLGLLLLFLGFLAVKVKRKIADREIEKPIEPKLDENVIDTSNK